MATIIFSYERFSCLWTWIGHPSRWNLFELCFLRCRSYSIGCAFSSSVIHSRHSFAFLHLLTVWILLEQFGSPRMILSDWEKMGLPINRLRRLLTSEPYPIATFGDQRMVMRLQLRITWPSLLFTPLPSSGKRYRSIQPF